MKKLVFAAQVFGLIAMFPVVVILEINHGTGNLSKSNSIPNIKLQTDIIDINLPQKGKDKMENESIPITIDTSLLMKEI